MDDTKILEATILNLKNSVHQKEKEMEQLKRELNELKRKQTGFSIGSKGEVDRLTNKVAFLEHELQQSQQKEQSLQKQVEELKNGGERDKKKIKEELPLRPRMVLKEENVRRKVGHSGFPDDGPLTKAHSSLMEMNKVKVEPIKLKKEATPKKMKTAVIVEEKKKEDSKAVVVASADVGWEVKDEPSKVLTKKLFKGNAWFNLCQVSAFEDSVKEFSVAVTTQHCETLAVCLCSFLRDCDEFVIGDVIEVVAVVLQSVPYIRCLLVKNVAVRKTDDNEAKACSEMMSILLDLLPHKFRANFEVLRALTSLYSLFLSEVQTEDLSVFMKFFGKEGFVCCVLAGETVPIALKTGIVKTLSVLMKCRELYERAKVPIIDSEKSKKSVLRTVIDLLLSQATEELLDLKRAIIEMFAVVVSTYDDWDTVLQKESKVEENDWDFGARLIYCLFDAIQMMKKSLKCVHVGKADEQEKSEAVLNVGKFVCDTFLLLSECSKSVLIQATLFGKTFRQLYVSSLVYLCDPKHPSLKSLKFMAKYLLNQLNSAIVLQSSSQLSASK